ncbi:MAG: hypothetical protein GXP54_00505 [Deltaproteobacteria bacterium]|nr:hypothetical protein [Deltaproteobacteria bacterium]
MKTLKGVLTCVLGLLVAVGCGDRTTNGGVDYSGTDLTGLDAETLSLELPSDLPWNPWDQGKSDLAKSDLPKSDLPKGDNPPQYGTTISEIQNSDNSIKCLDGFQNYEEGFQLVDVVVTAPRYKASSSKDGYFVAETGLSVAEPWKGVAVTVDSAQGTNYPVGTVLSMMVDHLEYYCFTELEVVSHQDKGTAAVPAPAVINPADVGSQDPATAEQWEGVLVQVNNVEVTEAVVNGSDGKDHGMFRVTGGLIVANDYHLNYMNKDTDQRTLGDKFDAIIGVITYSFGNYELLPRWDADLVPEGGLADTPPEAVSETIEPAPESVEDVPNVAEDVPETTEPTPETAEDVPNVSEDVIAEVYDFGPGEEVEPDVNPAVKTVYSIQSADPSAKCAVEENGEVIETGIQLKNVVVTSPKVFVSGSIRGYYVSDQVATAGEYTGILATFPSDWTLDLIPGDIVTVDGDYVEHFCFSEIDATTIDKTGTGAVPAAAQVGADVFAGGGSAASEPWEGVYVKLTDTLTVQDAAGGNKPAWWFKVKTDSANDIFVSNNFDIDDNGANTPAANDVFTSIAGFVKYSWGTYLIAPPAIDDLVK